MSDITPKMKAGIELVGGLIAENKRLKEEAFKQKLWLDDAKRAAGFSYNTSFDVVWEAALKALIESRAKSNDPQ